jgi:hypothetical protein
VGTIGLIFGHHRRLKLEQDAWAGMSNQDQVSIPRKEWVLLLLSVRDAGEPLDPVRIQSAMFMLSHDSALRDTPPYEFELVDSAPYSPAVLSDLAELEEAGLAARHLVAGYTWSEFAATPAGMEHAAAAVSRMPPGTRGPSAARSGKAVRSSTWVP